jgi:hypothetical protein
MVCTFVDVRAPLRGKMDEKFPINNILTKPAYHVNVTNGNLLPFVTYAAAAFGEG